MSSPFATALNIASRSQPSGRPRTWITQPGFQSKVNLVISFFSSGSFRFLLLELSASEDFFPLPSFRLSTYSDNNITSSSMVDLRVSDSTSVVFSFGSTFSPFLVVKVASAALSRSSCLWNSTTTAPMGNLLRFDRLSRWSSFLSQSSGVVENLNLTRATSPYLAKIVRISSILTSYWLDLLSPSPISFIGKFLIYKDLGMFWFVIPSVNGTTLLIVHFSSSTTNKSVNSFAACMTTLGSSVCLLTVLNLSKHSTGTDFSSVLVSSLRIKRSWRTFASEKKKFKRSFTASIAFVSSTIFVSSGALMASTVLVSSAIVIVYCCAIN